MLKFSLIVLLFICSYANAQTKAIAFKSHSGNLQYYTPKGNDNFGIVEPMPRLDSIVRINDSTVVQFHNTIQGPFFYDTLQNHPFWNQPNLNIDSLKDANYTGVKFIGFKPKKISKRQVQVVKPMREKKNKKRKKLTIVNPKNQMILNAV